MGPRTGTHNREHTHWLGKAGLMASIVCVSGVILVSYLRPLPPVPQLLLGSEG